MDLTELKSKVWDLAERISRKVSDRLFLTVIFRRRFGRWPAQLRPRTFNERLLRYKLSSRGDPRMPLMSDKIAVKAHVAKRIGEQHVIPLLWQGDRLPPRSERRWAKPYVLKSAHGWNSQVFVLKDADENWDDIEAKCESWLATTHGAKRLEWHYFHIPKRLLVEAFIGREDEVPPDYKFFVFHGRVELIWKDEGRYKNQKRYTFDRNWRPLEFDFYHRRGPIDPRRPDNLDEMISIAEALGDEFDFVSIDLYNVDGRIYFGEMTFFPASGRGLFFPPEGDLRVGEFWREAEQHARSD